MANTEKKEAIALANRVLDPTSIDPATAASLDPDSDLAILSRQFLRALEVVDKQEAKIKEFYQTEYDPMADLIQANRDEILEKHKEAVRIIGNVLVGGGHRHDQEKLVFIGRVLLALNTFHPMHCESWKGFPSAEVKS